MKFKNLKYEQKSNALILTFSNPERLNALSRAVLNEFSEALSEIDKLSANDASIRSLILTGEGKAFIAGADIKEMRKMSPIEACEFSRLGNRVLRKLEKMRLPVIAAVNGFALGGGFEVVLASDFSYAAENARFGLPEATLGIIPGFCGSKRLVDRVGAAVAKEMIFTGRIIDAAEALRLGIINKVCLPEELLENVVAVSDEMVKTSPNSVKEVKEILNFCGDNNLETMLAFETNKFGLIFSHADSVEGQDAFISKRKPKWRT